MAQLTTRDKVKGELEREVPLETLSSNVRTKIFKMLEFIDRENRQGRIVTSGILRHQLGMEIGTAYKIRKWLLKQGMISEVGGKSKQYSLLPAGVDALEKREMIQTWESAAENLGLADTFERQMSVFSSVFGEGFRYLWARLYRHGDVERYRVFLDATEGEIFGSLNARAGDQLRQPFERVEGHLEIPYLSIQRVPLKPLVYDAKLSLRLGHYLTPNHRYVLVASGTSVVEIDAHNREWVRRFEEEEIPGEDERDNGWRLILGFFVRREREQRVTLVTNNDDPAEMGDIDEIKADLISYYREWDKTWSRDGFDYSGPWQPSIDKAKRELDLRKSRKKAVEYGLLPNTLVDLPKNSHLQSVVEEPDGSMWWEFYDKEGALLERRRINS